LPLCLVTSYKWDPFRKFEYIWILTNKTMSFLKNSSLTCLEFVLLFLQIFSYFLFPKKIEFEFKPMKQCRFRKLYLLRICSSLLKKSWFFIFSKIWIWIYLNFNQQNNVVFEFFSPICSEFVPVFLQKSFLIFLFSQKKMNLNF
jgi:hypothetical protein